MQYAIAAALRGDRSHQRDVHTRRSSERARLTARSDERDSRHALRDAARRVLRDAAGDRCRRARPTRTSSSACCARPACSSSTDRASAPIPPTARSASCSSPRRAELEQHLRRDRAHSPARFLPVSDARVRAAVPCAAAARDRARGRPAWYVALTLVMTWPLAAGLTTRRAVRPRRSAAQRLDPRVEHRPLLRALGGDSAALGRHLARQHLLSRVDTRLAIPSCSSRRALLGPARVRGRPATSC